MDFRVKSFLDMLAWSEIGAEILAQSDNGYNVLVGSTPQHILTFPSYNTHPNIYNKITNSTAAGRYQFLYKYWPSYQKMLNLPDFGHDSQDRWAVQLIKECGALPMILNQQIETAISRCSSRWASLPGNSYNQHINSMQNLVNQYQIAWRKYGSTAQNSSN